MAKLYRVEHSSDNRGPFTSYNERGYLKIYSKRVSWKFIQRFGSLPSLYSDHELGLKHDEIEMYKCAFQYKTEIKCYFPKKEILELKNLGFDVVEVHVPRKKIKASSHQAVYKESDVKARLVITELFI